MFLAALSLVKAVHEHLVGKSNPEVVYQDLLRVHRDLRAMCLSENVIFAALNTAAPAPDVQTGGERCAVFWIE